MAMIKGVNERVHLPLYDSFFVRPARQLRELAPSNVLKFFVNIQGKTKLETNMQSSSILPHWNTFEARALRVVISDLPAVFPPQIETCINEPNGAGDGEAGKFDSCLADIESLLDDFNHRIGCEQVTAAGESLNTFNDVLEHVRGISEDIEACLGLLRRFCDPARMGQILQMQSNLRAIREDLAAVLKRTRVTVTKSKEVGEFLDGLAELEAKGDEYDLLRRMREAKSCLDAFVQLNELARRLKGKSLDDVDPCVAACERLIETAPHKIERLNHVKECLIEAVAEIGRLKAQLRQAQVQTIKECLNRALGDKRLMPIDAQLFNSGEQILAKLIYNSVTTLFVGEKVMMQMPTWFFPSGGGPFSEHGQVATHGLPSPQATFRFAEPVFIDTQQNFRVEIEFPEAAAAEELQRIYGPFFMWVVVDGYMSRDVQ